MSRPKGSKNKPKSLSTNQTAIIKHKRNPRIKKIIDKSSESDIKSALEKARKQKKDWQEELKYKHVLPLEYPFFIQATSTCYVLKQFNEEKDDNGEYKSPKPICYASRLADILKVSATRLIRIPSDVEECADNIQHIYDMIDDRLENIRPCELFEDFKTAQELRSSLEDKEE